MDMPPLDGVLCSNNRSRSLPTSTNGKLTIDFILIFGTSNWYLWMRWFRCNKANNNISCYAMVRREASDIFLLRILRAVLQLSHHYKQFAYIYPKKSSLRRFSGAGRCCSSYEYANIGSMHRFHFVSTSLIFAIT